MGYEAKMSSFSASCATSSGPPSPARGRLLSPRARNQYSVYTEILVLPQHTADAAGTQLYTRPVDKALHRTPLREQEKSDGQANEMLGRGILKQLPCVLQSCYVSNSTSARRDPCPTSDSTRTKCVEPSSSTQEDFSQPSFRQR